MRRTETVEEYLARGGKITYEKSSIIQQVDEETIKSFYKTQEWKDIRNRVYRELTHFCPVCGSEENLVVDHIKPVRYFWEERLNPNNLQILCNECNLEKSSIINWTLEFHIKNKKQLEKEKRNKTLLIETKKQRAEGIRTFSGLNHTQVENLNRTYMSFRQRCNKERTQPLTKYDYRQAIEKVFGIDSWFEPTKVKKYIKENWHSIINCE